MVNIDIDKILFKFDDEEYNKVLSYLGTEPILFWKRKLKYGMELINE